MHNKLIHFKKIDSTNTYGLKKFDELTDGTVIIADEQTAGRGRFDRVWVSENYENIYLSFILKPDKKNYLVNITQYLSVVVAKVIESYEVNCCIKYPNDVLVYDKKICGILCESSLKKNVLQGIVLGVGINLNMPKDIVENIDRPATSLNLITNTKIDKQVFLNKLLDEFFKNYQKVVDEGFSFFKEDYLNRTHFLGKTVWIQQRDGAIKEEVTALKIDDNGNLVVKTIENVEKIIYSGDVLLS